MSLSASLRSCARDRRHRRIDGGEVGGAQEHAGRKALVGAAQHAAGVVGLDQALGGDLDVADGSAGQHMGDVAEGVLMGVELGVGRDVDLPLRHILPVMAAGRHAQDLDHARWPAARSDRSWCAGFAGAWWTVKLVVRPAAYCEEARHARACPGHPRSSSPRKSKNVDGRDKPGHDDIPFSSAGGHQIKYCFVMISPSLELSVMNS